MSQERLLANPFNERPLANPFNECSNKKALPPTHNIFTHEAIVILLTYGCVYFSANANEILASIQ